MAKSSLVVNSVKFRLAIYSETADFWNEDFMKRYSVNIDVIIRKNFMLSFPVHFRFL